MQRRSGLGRPPRVHGRQGRRQTLRLRVARGQANVVVGAARDARKHRCIGIGVLNLQPRVGLQEREEEEGRAQWGEGGR